MLLPVHVTINLEHWMSISFKENSIQMPLCQPIHQYTQEGITELIGNIQPVTSCSHYLQGSEVPEYNSPFGFHVSKSVAQHVFFHFLFIYY